MKKPCCALILLLISAGAGAADLAAEVRAQLAQTPLLRGEFEQSKQVAGFAKPLLSSGDFVVARERGVLWNTRKPFANQLKLTRKQIVATQDGQVAFQLSASQEPSVRVINSLMFSLLSGDVSQLAHQFKIAGSSSPQGWKLSLLPLQPGLARLMTQVKLSGDKYVRRIEIIEASGDDTRIRFMPQTSAPASLTPEESAQFD